jgi:hypothetical protein
MHVIEKKIDLIREQTGRNKTKQKGSDEKRG